MGEGWRDGMGWESGERKGDRGRKEVRRKRRKGDGGGKGERSGGIVEGHNVLFMAFLFHTLHHISSTSWGTHRWHSHRTQTVMPTPPTATVSSTLLARGSLLSQRQQLVPSNATLLSSTLNSVAWRTGLWAGIESVTDYYCNAESLYTEEVTKDRTGN